MKQEQRRYVSQELILAEAIKEFGNMAMGTLRSTASVKRGKFQKDGFFIIIRIRTSYF